eukprot:m.461709 g.461709  ORF g.461709 m.461709 type:complete len:159 (-) comp22390_c0_seq1:98-574(-)
MVACSECKADKPRADFSGAQLKKTSRRCRTCVEGSAGAADVSEGGAGRVPSKKTLVEALADPATPLPEGARRMTLKEREDQVALVTMALTKQGLKQLDSEHQSALETYIRDGTPCKLDIKTPKGFVACTLANITNTVELNTHVPGRLVPEEEATANSQ